MTTFDLTAFAQYVISLAKSRKLSIISLREWWRDHALYTRICNLRTISFTEIALLCPADGQYKKL